MVQEDLRGSRGPIAAARRTLRVTEPLTTSLRGLWVSGFPSSGNGGRQREGFHVISVRCHLSKNQPGLPQKSSEKLCNEGKGPKYPAAQKPNGVVAPLAFDQVVAATAVHEQDRRVR